MRFVGIAELAAAAGLILPALTRIAPILTPIAAACILPVMGGAFFVDLKARNFLSLALVIVCSALASCVAWARFTRARIAPRVFDSGCGAERHLTLSLKHRGKENADGHQ